MESSDAMADTPSTPMSTPATPASTPTSPASTPPSTPASTPIPTDPTSADPKIPPTPDTTPPPTPKTTLDPPSTPCTPKSTPAQHTPDQTSTPGSPRCLTPASVSGTGTPTPHSPSPRSPTPEYPTPRPPTTPQSPSVAAAPPSHLPLAATLSFKSSLQVLLKKQDDELDRNREYKENEEAKEGEEERGEEEKKGETNKEEDREEPMKDEKGRSKEGRATKKDKKREDLDDEQQHKKRETNRKEIDAAKDENKEREERSEKGKETGKKDKRKKSLANETQNEEEKGKTPKGGTREKAKGKVGDQKKSERTEEVKKERSKPEGKKDGGEDQRKSHKEGRGEAKPQEKQSEDKTRERSKRKEREKEDGEVEAKKSKPEDKCTTEEERGKNIEKTTIKEGKSTRWRDEEEVTKGEKAQGDLYIKKGEQPFSRWKRYYFVLDGKLLTYYRSEQDYKNRSGVKGSWDLAMLEQVTEKQPGLLRSNFPFKISRRSLPSVSLAAETKEDRERWMEAICELLQRLLHLTDHSSSNPTRRATHAHANKTEHKKGKKTKYSTLPSPQKLPSSPSISTSEDEDELELKEEKEEEGNKEEEPQLIMPKKIPRVAIGLPMGVPVRDLKLDGVKLKKVELPSKKESPKEEGENVKINASEKDQDNRGEEEGTENRKSSAGEMFGVKLKRISPEKKLVNDGDKAKEAAGEGIKKRSEEKKEGKEDFTSVNLKRPTKQPVIPLNTTGLLARPKLQSPKVSPGSQKRSTTERKKSPSPTIPISRSVQALTKSAEEVKATNKDILSDTATSTENDSNLKGKLDSTAQTIKIKEIKYPDVVNLDDNQETVAPLKNEGEAVLSDLKNSKERKEAKEEEEEEEEFGEKNTSLPIPEVSVVLRSDSDEETEYEKCSSENEVQDTGSHETKTSDTPPSPALSSSVERTNASSSLDSPRLPIPRDVPVKTSAMKCDSDSQDNEELDNTTTQNTKAASTKKQNSPLPLDSSPTRRRNNTNDSSCSSQLCDTDGTERKQGKFKRFLIKRSSSSAGKERKEDWEGKELKDRKRRSGNAFSKFLSGKKSKDKIGKSNDEDTEVQSGETVEENSGSREQSRPNQVPAIEVSMATILAVSEERTDAAKERERQAEIISQTGKELSEVNEEHLASTRTEDLVERRERSQSREALRGSNYSSSSREQEPAPSLPEKTRVRAISPNHDIPQCNRPVIYKHDTHDVQTTEDEARQPVDGYITEKQILDILSATDREKRRMSQGRLQGPLLSVPNGGGTDGTGQTWAEDSSSKRPSYISLTSMESDDPLPTTNFLGCERNSSSSGSLKARESDSSGCEEPEPPTGASLRKPSRPTDSLTVGKRVSLTLPEFTVVEEDGLASPDTAKTLLPSDSNVDSVKERKEEDEPSVKQQQEHKGKHHTVDENREKTIDEKEKEEQGDYFPVVGRGDGEERGEVELRLLHTSQAPPMRTSGITGLQQYLKEEEGEAGEVRSGISRLGHSAAVEKLKQTAEDL